MKKQYSYIMLLAFFIVTVSFVVIKYKNKTQAENNVFYSLLPRTGNDLNKAEWKTSKENTEKLIVKIKLNRGDLKSAIALANAYIIEARISGNIAYYDNAAMKRVEHVLKTDPNNSEGLMLKSLIQLSQHHFADGLATAETAVSANPNNSFGYGLLVDANVEMGNYEAALAAADKMVTTRPDLRSYSRIAYLREIYGDYAGAIDAMKLAVDAGVPAEEATEWCRAQLGKLFESTVR